MDSTPSLSKIASSPQLGQEQTDFTGKYYKERSQVVVRMKPIGKGETDQFKQLTAENKYQNKEYVGCSYESHTVAFKDLKSSGRLKEFKYPDVVATDEFDNKRLYEETVAPKIPVILDGFNMIVVAYGQTGSGKTHTLIGKLGVFKQAPSDNLDNLDDNLGLFPRAALALFQGMKQKSQPNFMTITMCESPAFLPMDLTTKKPIWLEPTTNELIGGKEHMIESYEDIFRLGAHFENERSVGATKFNNTSSRSHAMIWIRLYTQIENDKVHVNHLKICDLAGSERVSQVSEYKNNDDYQTSVMINWSLTMLSQAISKLAESKPVIDGGPIPKHVVWKDYFITRVMKEAYQGLAITSFVFCAKQHDHNSGETYSTMIYGERFKQLTGKVCRPKPISLRKFIQTLEKRIEESKTKIKRMQESARKDESRIELNQLFIAADSSTIKYLSTFL